MGKVIDKPYRGEPDLRFEEGAKGEVARVWIETLALQRKLPVTAIPRAYGNCAEVLLYQN